MENQSPANWRVSIKALIRDERGRVLLVQEDDGHAWWGFPGGGLDHGEDVETALRREIREELGVAVAAIEPAPSFVCTVTAIGDNPENKPGRKYKLWLVFRVELAGPPAPPSGNRCKWFAPDDITRDALADYFAPQYDRFILYLKQ